MFNFKIGKMSITLTMVDIQKARFVIDMQQPFGEQMLVVTIQLNKSEDVTIEVKAEVYKGIPF